MVKLTGIITLILSASSLTHFALGHPGEHQDSTEIKRQIAKNELIARSGATKLARCAESPHAKALRQRAIARRNAKVEELRQKLRKRTADEVQTYDDISHNYTGSVSDNDDVFSSNTSCILEPQMTIGPYWVSGELIRQDDREDQEGVEMTLELQLIDTNTCEAVSDLYIDKWHANSTGVYAGIKESSLNSTYLRAIQVTDDDGVVTFDTLIPGHYEGRATHTHIMVHQDVTAYSNETYAGGTVRSIGQLFYESALRSALEAVEPYSSNTNSITTNEDDSLLSGTTLGDFDPFVDYIYLGDSISDGIFAWHSIGIDLSANYTDNESAASAYYETGGVDESGSSSFGGGSGGAPGGSSNGTGMNGTGSPPGGFMMSASTGTVVMLSGTAKASASSSVISAGTSTASSGAATRGSFIKSVLSRQRGSATALPVQQSSGVEGSRGNKASGKKEEHSSLPTPAGSQTASNEAGSIHDKLASGSSDMTASPSQASSCG